MNFKELNIKPCYESGVDDIIEDYYVPVLGASVHYDRIAGFFASSSMAVAARGLSEFIQNGGKMRLITSPRLNSDDLEVVRKIAENSEDLSLRDFGIDTDNLETEFEKRTKLHGQDIAFLFFATAFQILTLGHHPFTLY